MKVEEQLYYSELFDAYKPLLTQSQCNVIEDYLNGNLTVSEIAENHSITRQAVKDMVNKSLKKLEECERKLHFVEKIDILEKKIEVLEKQIKKGDF